ncbi:hypothetical protein KGM_213186B, partial [Danaus plexippus plexippus]
PLLDREDRADLALYLNHLKIFLQFKHNNVVLVTGASMRMLLALPDVLSDTFVTRRLHAWSDTKYIKVFKQPSTG